MVDQEVFLNIFIWVSVCWNLCYFHDVNAPISFIISLHAGVYPNILLNVHNRYLVLYTFCAPCLIFSFHLPKKNYEVKRGSCRIFHQVKNSARYIGHLFVLSILRTILLWPSVISVPTDIYGANSGWVIKSWWLPM